MSSYSFLPFQSIDASGTIDCIGYGSSEGLVVVLLILGFDFEGLLMLYRILSPILFCSHGCEHPRPLLPSAALLVEIGAAESLLGGDVQGLSDYLQRLDDDISAHGFAERDHGRGLFRIASA